MAGFSINNLLILILISALITVFIEYVRRRHFSLTFNLKIWIISVISGFFGSAVVAGILESAGEINIEFGSKPFYFLFIGISAVTYIFWLNSKEKNPEE
ncbi:MAG: hypothetical protein K1X92_17720 [Bacteroidia bacterium]|nr:hypothetical protein [Bacteroidia bacterium]